MPDSQPYRRRIAGVLILLAVAASTAALLALPRAAFATNPCDSDTPPSSCFDTHTETQDVTLSVSKTAGTVTSNPAGISCGVTCSATAHRTRSCDYYDCSDWVSPSYTLTASSGPAGFAPNWGGDCSGTATTCSLTLDTDKSVSLGWTDVTDPTVSLTSPGGKAGQQMAVSAVAGDNAGVAKVEFLVDGAVKLTDTSAPYSGTISTSGYADGSTHTVSARAYDTSGRVSTLSGHSVVVDRSVSLSADTLPAYTNAASLLIGFSTDGDVPAANIKCAVGAAAPVTCSSPFSPAIPSDGAYIATISVTDDVGNSATVTRSFTVDRTDPTVSFTSGPAEGASVAPGNVTIGFNATDASPLTTECAVDGGSFGACSTGSSETLAGLAAGSHGLAVRATDAAGNPTVITRHFTVSTPAPSGAGGGTGGGSGVLGAGPTSGRSAAAKLSSSFKLKGKHTMVKKLGLSGVPAGSTVKVSCKGHGCPFRSKSVRPRGSTVSLAGLFKGKKLSKGVTVEIDVSTPGASTQVFKLTTRSGKKPRVAVS